MGESAQPYLGKPETSQIDPTPELRLDEEFTGSTRAGRDPDAWVSDAEVQTLFSVMTLPRDWTEV